MNRIRPELLIFDFDGVIADTEFAANRLLAELLTQRGYNTSLSEAYLHYQGRSWADCLNTFENLWGVPAPDNLRSELDSAIEYGLHKLEPVNGTVEFLEKVRGYRKCIASSSLPTWIEKRLRLLNLFEFFEGSIFSAAVHVRRGKPHPDIYVHAAQTMGVQPGSCLVIEDSSLGVTAAVAAGAPVVGLCAASHIQTGHSERLLAAGATYVCESYSQIESILEISELP